jgi:hypothetical protein
MARIKWDCRRNRREIEKKVRDLAAESSTTGTRLSPSSRTRARRRPTTRPSALRRAVISRRISFGTRTDGGSRFCAAGLSVIDTRRKRGVDPWTYAPDLIAAVRTNLPLPTIPANAAA